MKYVQPGLKICSQINYVSDKENKIIQEQCKREFKKTSNIRKIVTERKDILKVFPCCNVMCATMSTPTLIAQIGHTCKSQGEDLYQQQHFEKKHANNCFIHYDLCK